MAWSQLGGPSWTVGLGRSDSTTASRSLANASIPPPTSNLSALITSFSAQGLSVKNMVALSGNFNLISSPCTGITPKKKSEEKNQNSASIVNLFGDIDVLYQLTTVFKLTGSHTIGLARCTSFRRRIYNDSNIDASFAQKLRMKCPKSGNDNVLQRLDIQTPTHFDNFYFNNLLQKKGLLHSDQELFNGSSVDSLVKKYACDSGTFFKDFARAMIKMSKIKPAKGSNGQIRKNCRKVN